MSTSTTFERFRVSCFDNTFGATRDGLDIEATEALIGGEREKAEGMILDSLVDTNDSRPIIASGVMRICAAAPILKERLRSGFESRYNYLRVHAAHALYRIEEWSDAAATIIDVLNNTPMGCQWTRMMAVEALGDFARDPRCHETLFAAVEDEDNFIGFLAVQSLKKVFSQSAPISALIDSLHETQLEPNRWKSRYLEQRRIAFAHLGSATSIRMPAVATEQKKSAQQVAASDEQSLFTFNSTASS